MSTFTSSCRTDRSGTARKQYRLDLAKASVAPREGRHRAQINGETVA